MSKCPKITVLMSVYNGGQFLREAIESILTQTYKDFEFLIINDASTDSSRDIIDSYKDSRIRLVDNEVNLGLAASLNKGLDLAFGEYVARMDCDDISLPSRLEKQVAFMDSQPDVAVCGTWIEIFGNKRGLGKFPTQHDEIKIHLYFQNSLNHSSVILRKKMLQKHDLKYNPEFYCAQDYDLWIRCAKCVQMANIPEILIRYRCSENQMGQRQNNLQEELADRIRIRELTNLGIELQNENYELHKSVSLLQFQASKEFIIKSEKWFSFLLTLFCYSDKLNLHVDKKLVAGIIADKWFNVCSNATTLGLWVCWKYVSSQLKGTSKIRLLKRALYLLIKCPIKTINDICLRLCMS